MEKITDEIIDVSEVKHLEYILKTANEQLEKSEQKCKNKQEEIIKSKQEQRENASNQMGNLLSNDGFEELVTLSQYAQQISMQINDYEMEEQKIGQLQKIIKSPYFARIDLILTIV